MKTQHHSAFRILPSALALAVAMATASAAPAPAELDRVALAWFPKEIQASSPAIARRFDFARGVEYGYVYCTNLFGHLGDVHAVRIELGKATVRPHIDEGALNPDKKARLRTTSAAAAGTKALFSVNGGFFSWSELIPYYRMKIDGKILESHTGGTFGLAFSNDGSRIRLCRVKDDELAGWDNFFAGEGILMGGKSTLDSKKPAGVKTKPEAPRTLLGMDADGKYLWVIVTGGRKTGRKPSMGLSYRDGADLLQWFGCTEGMSIDGGGSTTLAVREDVLRGVAAPVTPEAHPAKTGGYVILNCTSDGKERAVLDHLQFLDAAPR